MRTPETLTVALHGVTGRMGTNQHLTRSLLAIINDGGFQTSSGQPVGLRLILVGRDEAKLRHLSEHVAAPVIGHVVDWSTDLAEVLADPSVDVVFDSAGTAGRGAVLSTAIDHGKAVYCEKPVADNSVDAYKLADRCEQLKIKNGVVQDKLWLPGIRRLFELRDAGFFGRILGVRSEFGYWVFDGQDPARTPQRPSWYYRSEDGGGMVNDMFCHWHYLITNLIGPIKSVIARAQTGIPQRIDESGNPYQCTADDAVSAIIETESGIACQFNNSWTARVRRDDLFQIQIDGTHGSAVAGLRDCWTQSDTDTPRPTWNPDVAARATYYDDWQCCPAGADDGNAFKRQWELFFRHVIGDGDFPWTLRSGAEGVALAEAAMQSSQQRRWIDLAEVVNAATLTSSDRA